MQSTKNESSNISMSVYFYSRLDWNEILSELSPWRSKIEKSVPFFHYLGIIANIICMLVFSKKNLIKRKSIFFLTILAFSDLMYNVLSVLPNFLLSIRLVSYNIYKTSDASCFMYDFGITSFHFYSVLITLLITADRFDHISRPLKLDRKLSNIKSKKQVGICLYFVALIIAIPHGLLMIFNEKENDCDARSFFRQTFLSTNLTYYQLYFMFVEPILFWLLPGISIMFMNFVVIFKIFKSNEIYSKKFTVNFSRPSLKRLKSENTFISGRNNSIKSIDKSLEAKISSEKLGKIKIKFNKENNFLDLPIINNSVRCPRLFLDEIQHDTLEKRGRMLEQSKKDTILQNCKTTQKMYTTRLSVNQVSHYLTIIIVGFYFILSTIPYGIILTFQNNLTLNLNYVLDSRNDYLNDPLWIRFGIFREWVIIFRILFISNHCFNFFLYVLFNRVFRKTLFGLFKHVSDLIQELHFSSGSNASFL